MEYTSLHVFPLSCDKISHEFHRKITNKKYCVSNINTCTHKFELLMSWTLLQMLFY